MMKIFWLLLLLATPAAPGFGAGSCANPTIALAGGTYAGTQTTTITAACAAICYTVNGSTPAGSNGTCTAGTTYAGAVTIDRTMTLKAVATQAAKTTSGVASAAYTIEQGPPRSKGRTIVARAAVGRKR